jgi:hypothetical protein
MLTREKPDNPLPKVPEPLTEGARSVASATESRGIIQLGSLVFRRQRLGSGFAEDTTRASSEFFPLTV